MCNSRWPPPEGDKFAKCPNDGTDQDQSTCDASVHIRLTRSMQWYFLFKCKVAKNPRWPPLKRTKKSIKFRVH